MPGNRNAAALIAVIEAAFRDAPEVNREALMYEGSWETTSLMRDLTAVSDMPNDSFIESLRDPSLCSVRKGCATSFLITWSIPRAIRSPR